MDGPVIITRAEPGNSETARVLAQSDKWVLPILQAPMLVIEPTGAQLPPDFERFGLVFTSSNGVRAFCKASDKRDALVYCVGVGTEMSARDAGFQDVRIGADGTSKGLLDTMLSEQGSVGDTPFLHIANDAAAGRLVKGLNAGGIKAEFSPLYKARPVTDLPNGIGEALAGTACAVLVHSAKGAEAFANASEGLEMSAHILVAISDTAADPLRHRLFAKVCTAQQPNEAGILSALFRAHSML